jgi:hypothetical protein
MRRALTALGCVGLAFALVAAPAQAKKKKKAGLGPVVTVTAPGTTPPTSSLSSVTATCPAKTKVVGGGFSAPFNAASTAVVYASTRSSSRAWTVKWLTGTMTTGAATAYAYCRRGAKAIQDVTGTATLPGTGTAASASAVCPAGKRLISGGFETTTGPSFGSFGIVQDSNSTAANTWTIREVNNTSGNQTITSHAYCTAGIKPKITSASQAANLSQLQSVTTQGQACPVSKSKGKKAGASKGKKKPRRRASAGGFSQPPLAPATTPILIITDSRLNGASWLNSAVSATPTMGSTSLTTQTVCA